MSTPPLHVPMSSAGPVLTHKRRRHDNELQRGISRAAGSGRGRTGLIIAGVVTLIAVVGQFVTPHSPTAFVGGSFAPPGGHALLGTDVLGRDVLSRVLAGGWSVLWTAVAATSIGVGLGTLAGISAAYAGGAVDNVVMRLADVILAFPQVVFALMLVSIAGPHLWLVVLAVGLSHAPQVARVMRAAALDVSERDYVKSAQLMGYPRRAILVRDILPNVTAPLSVEIGLRLTYSIIIIAGLSFLGFGIQPPASNWGVMVSENRIGLTLNVWSVLLPVVMIACLTIGVNLFTDALARAFGRDITRGRRALPVATVTEVTS